MAVESEATLPVEEEDVNAAEESGEVGRVEGKRGLEYGEVFFLLLVA